MSRTARTIASLTSLAALNLLAGCSALQVAQNAGAAYSSIRGASQAYHASSMVKDVSTAQPLFNGYDSIVIKASISPREQTPGLSEAVVGNLSTYTDQASRALGGRVKVCQEVAGCPGKVLVINLLEDAYDRNIVQKLTVGHLLSGKLLFTDASSGSVTAEKRVEVTSSYAELAQLTNATILAGLIKSFPPANEADSKRAMALIEAIPTVAPQYEATLKGRS